MFPLTQRFKSAPAASIAAPRDPARARVRGALVAFADRNAGLAMLLSPDPTGQFFSRALGPPPVAALLGAFYVA